MVDAWIRKCRCSRSDKLQLRQPVLIYYYQRLYLDLKFNAFHTARFSGFLNPVETSTSPNFFGGSCQLSDIYHSDLCYYMRFLSVRQEKSIPLNQQFTFTELKKVFHLCPVSEQKSKSDICQTGINTDFSL